MTAEAAHPWAGACGRPPRERVSCRLLREVAELNPGYGAWVMATAIVSTGLQLFGHNALSAVLLVVACAAFALLLVAYTWRFIGYRAQALADARDPSRAFSFLPARRPRLHGRQTTAEGAR